MIEIPEFPELTFNDAEHRYFLNGEEIPSVSALMKPLSDDFYNTVNQSALEKAAKRGTAIHNAIENYTRFGIEDIEPEFSDYFNSFMEWWELRKPVPICMEHMVYHKILRYGGRVDLLAMIDGKVTLVDYKSSYKVNDKLCAVQVEGYDRAFESHGVKVEDRLILHLARNGYKEHQFQRSSKCWSVMSSLITVHNYISQ